MNSLFWWIVFNLASVWAGFQMGRAHEQFKPEQDGVLKLREVYVLMALGKRNEQLDGNAIQDAVHAFGGKISVGALYVALENLESNGYVASTPARSAERGIERDVFCLTAKGREKYAAMVKKQARLARWQWR